MKKYLIVFITSVLLLSSFQIINDSSPEFASCSLVVTSVNDSIHVVENYNQGYTLSTQVMMGNPNVVVSNDTIYSGTGNYVIAIAIRDSSDCAITKLITKLQ